MAKQLNQKDLVEFRLRLTAVNNARHQYMMVSESYQTWIQQTLKAYKLKGKFNIDPNTGEMTPAIEGVPDAGSNAQAQTG